MPQVPVYQRTEQDRPAYRQDLTSRVTPDEMGAGIGGALQSVAQGFGQAAQAATAIRDMEDTTRAKEADNALAAWSRDAMYGEGGFMTLEGKAAVDGQAEFQRKWGEQRKALGGGLTPGAARMYAEAAIVRQQQVEQTALVHTAEQRKQWAASASTARLDTFSQDALAGFSDPKKVEFNIAAGQAELRQRAQEEGWDPATLANQEQSFISSVRKNVALRMAVKDPLAAHTYLDANREQMTGTDQFDVEKTIETDVKKEKAKSEAARIVGMIGDGKTDLLKELDGIQDPDVREMTRQTVAATLSLQAAAEKQTKDNATEQAFNMIEKDHLSPYDLPPEVTQVIGMEGMKQLMSYWEARSHGGIVTDEKTLYDLQTKYATDPVAFGQEDLFQYRKDLSDQDWKQVNDWRQTALQDGHKATTDGLALTSAFSQANDQLEAVGLTTTGLSGGQREQAAGRIAAFNNVLSQRMQEFKRDHDGRNPDQAEVQAMINQLLLPVVIQRGNRPQFGLIPNPFEALGALFSGGDKKGFVFEAGTRPDGTSVDVKVDYADVPIDLRQAIATDLARDLGRQPSEEEVANRYEQFVLAGP